MRHHANPNLEVSQRGRPRSVSDQVIANAIALAEEKDLRKDSCTSSVDVMSVVDNLRREELAHMGLNPYIVLPVLSRSTKSRVL